MKSLRVQWSVYVLVVVAGCGGSTTAPAPAPDVAGSWTGSETDRLGTAFLTWQIVQVGDSVSGTATIRPVDAADGSCASCHKSKVGTLSGTVSARTIKIAMFFPAGAAGDPTPACSIILNSIAPLVGPSGIAGSYIGSDPCEGTFTGVLVMQRQP